MMFRNSTTEPGQPWVRISGSASGSGERTCRKCTFCPSMSVVNCGILVQPRLVRRASRTSVAPVVGQLLQVVQRHPGLPAGAGQLARPAGVGEPVAQVVEAAWGTSMRNGLISSFTAVHDYESR